MTSFIRPSMLILLPRMKWLREIIDTSLKLPELYYFKCMCPSLYGPMLFPSLFFFINWIIIFLNKPLFPIEPLIYGCTCFVRDVHPHVSKLDPKALKCIFLGYSWFQKGYRCYCPSLHRYLVLVDVTFLENVPFSLPFGLHELGGGRHLTCLYSCLTHCLPRTNSCPCSSKTSYHLSLYSTLTTPGLEPSTSCFDIRSSS